MEKKIFFAEEIEFKFPGKKIGQDEIIDVINNPFWIDIQTGEIKYIDFQVSTNPNDVVTVASSFKGFCMQIKKRTI
jgi:hypothetical protein